ncbi:MAG: DNA/RNA non-specific endonuclease, partial [Saonia sp.]
MKKKTTYTILLIVCIVGFWVFENFYTPDTYSAPQGEGLKTLISSDFLPSSTTGAIVAHNHFSLSYHEAYEQAEWVAY